jgi:hypothetical protein
MAIKTAGQVGINQYTLSTKKTFEGKTEQSYRREHPCKKFVPQQ